MKVKKEVRNSFFGSFVKENHSRVSFLKVALFAMISACAPDVSSSVTQSQAGNDLIKVTDEEARKQVSDCEWSLLKQNPLYIPYAYLCFKSATEKTIIHFKSGHWNGNSNAFKHSFGSACLAKNTNLTFAAQLSTAHELPSCRKNPDEIINSTNDLANNSFGIQLVANTPKADLNQIEEELLKAVCTGKLSQVRKRDNGSAQRTPTDCVDHKLFAEKVKRANQQIELGKCEFLEVGGLHIGFPGELRANLPSEQNPIGESLGGVGSGLPLRMTQSGAVMLLNKEKWLNVRVQGGVLANRVGWMRLSHVRPRHGVCLP